MPLQNLTWGEAHAKENVTVRLSLDGTVTVAATAAPIDDPGSEGWVILLTSRWEKDPYYLQKDIQQYQDLS